MAKINLRPWREELRAERQKQFVVMLLGAVIIAAGLVFIWHAHMNDRIAYQHSRNAYIEKATKALDQKIAQINDLKKRREELLARMKVIQDLQGKRPVIVRIFDELVRTLPDGLYYTSLQRKGNTLHITGMAESNSRISQLMRNFENSNWFTNPNLLNVSAANSKKAGYSEFHMTVQETSPQADTEKKK